MCHKVCESILGVDQCVLEMDDVTIELLHNYQGANNLGNVNSVLSTGSITYSWPRRVGGSGNNF